MKTTALAVSCSLLLATAAFAGHLELVTRVEPGLVSDTGSGAQVPAASRPPALSGDGRYVAFESAASNLVPGQFDRNAGIDVFLHDRVDGTTVLVSYVGGSPGVTPAIDSYGPAISDDGRYVAFLGWSHEIPGGPPTSGTGPGVFLYDRVLGMNLQVTRDFGANPAADDLAISADGRYVAFASTKASEVPGQTDTGHASDVFLYDRESGTTTLVSHSQASPTAAGNAQSVRPRLSADGRFVVFGSAASDLVAGQSDTPDSFDIFLWDRVTGEIRLVSHAPGAPTTAAGAAHIAEISADGGWIAFLSAGSLIPGQINLTNDNNLFVFERATGTVTLVSHQVDSSTWTGNGPCWEPSISADGSRIAYSSLAGNLISWQSGGGKNVFVWDRGTGENTLVSHATTLPTDTGDASSGSPRISGDGNRIAFSSLSRSLVLGQDEAEFDNDVFRYDVASGTVTLASHAAASPAAGNSSSDAPAISSDGAWIGFVSYASDLAAGVLDTNANSDLFLHAVQDGANTLATRRHPDSPSVTLPLTSQVAGPPGVPSSADGRYIVFATVSPFVLPGVADTNRDFDLYLRDRVAGTTALITRSAAVADRTGDQGLFLGLTTPASVSADGRYAVFASAASDLVAGQVDPSYGYDVFLWDRDTGTTTLVSHASGSATEATGGIYPSISADGRYVAFVSGSGSQVFLFDRTTGGRTLVSHAHGSATTPANGISPEAWISADGGTVAFLSYATDLVPGFVDNGTSSNRDLYLWDRASGAITMVSRASGTSAASVGDVSAFSIGADGRSVAYLSDAASLAASQQDTNGQADVFLFDRDSGENRLVSRVAGTTATAAQWRSDAVSLSADGRWVVFTSFANDLVPGQNDRNGSRDTFLYEAATGRTALVSHAVGSAAATGDSFSFEHAISGDGRYVAFVNQSRDLVTPPLSAPMLGIYLYDRLLGGSVLVNRSDLFTLTAAGPQAVTTAIAPITQGLGISADGSTVLFSSHQDDLVAGDYNEAMDGFAYVQALPRGDFYTVTPCRLLDSREPGPALASSVTRGVAVAGRCGIPATARAVSVNITVTGPTAAGHLSLQAGDLGLPAASAINFAAGQTRANNAILPLALNGDGTLAITPFVLGGGSVHAIVDVNGYFE